MKELGSKESRSIYAGGGITASICAAIAAGVSFFVGLLDGITRPFRCR